MAEARRSPPDPIDIHVGRQLKQARLARGWTMLQLADAIGTQYQTVQKYERGEARISASTMWRLAHHLNVPVGVFFEGLQPGEGCNSKIDDPVSPLSP